MKIIFTAVKVKQVARSTKISAKKLQYSARSSPVSSISDV